MPAPISMDLRLRIVRAVERGSSIREAARRFAVSPSAAIEAGARDLTEASGPELDDRDPWDVVGQWGQAGDLALDGIDDDDIDAVPEVERSASVPGGHAFLERIYEDDAGEAVIRSYMVGGMGHAWPGGVPGLAYSDPSGPDASELLWAFFAMHAQPAP